MYTPQMNCNNSNGVSALFKSILDVQYRSANLVIGGDWNVALHAIDKKGGAMWKQNRYRDDDRTRARRYF